MVPKSFLTALQMARNLKYWLLDFSSIYCLGLCGAVDTGLPCTDLFVTPLKMSSVDFMRHALLSERVGSRE